jgi:mRNA interferase MazF
MAKQKVIPPKSPKRGEVWLVNFDPTIGSEINKTRPALIIQNDIGNTYSPVTIVAAITSANSQHKIYPTEVFISANIGGLQNDSLVLLNQIRTIDKIRLVKKMGILPSNQLAQVSRALEISLDTIGI